MINIKDFDPSLLKIHKKSHKSISIYNIGHITIKKIDDYENFYSVNPLYLVIGEVIGHIEENNRNRCLIFDSSHENKDVLKKYKELQGGSKKKIQSINDGECKYGKDFTKIKLDSDDDLPLNKPLNLHMLTIIVRSIFEDEAKFYPQVYLDDCLYELRV